MGRGVGLTLDAVVGAVVKLYENVYVGAKVGGDQGLLLGVAVKLYENVCVGSV
jgi:hypothetical protein